MPRIVTLIPYRLFPLHGGGALRCFHLLRQLARRHEVHAIVFQREEELRRGVEGYALPDSVRVYSPLDSPPPRTWGRVMPRRLARAIQHRWLRRSLRGPAEATLLACHHLVRRVLRENEVDAIVFEHLSAMGAAPLARRTSRATARILDAHNVDHELLAGEYNSIPAENVTRQQVRSWRNAWWTEHHLDRFVHGFWACSDLDRRALESASPVRGHTIPNGVDTRFFAFDDWPGKRQSGFLLLSGWMATRANQDGTAFLVDSVWPLLRSARPDLRLLVVGGGMTPVLRRKMETVPGVEVVGEVADVRPYARRAAAAVAPLRIGSGTRLKILEAMSQGLPVVSTRKGAEGIEASNGRHLFLADEPSDIADSVLRLLADEGLYRTFQQEGRRLVESRYDWDLVGDAAEAALHDTLDRVRRGGR